MTKPFGARLEAAIRDRGPLCVGIDPHPALLEMWGLPDDVGGLERFARTCTDALAGELAVLKPQSAFFERHGSRGIAVLETVIAECRSAGALVLLDVKRGDIGSTMRGYADAYLDRSSPLAADAMTATPYLGFESLRPLLEVAADNGAGVFVVTLTSNPEGRQVQQATGSAGRTVAAEILDAVRGENRDPGSLGSVGVVVGANLDPGSADLSVNGPVLAPGFGAQGGSVRSLAALFDGPRRGVLPSTSRDVLAAGPDPAGLRSAARRHQDELVANGFGDLGSK